MSKSNRDCLSCKNNNNIQDRRISKVEFSINPKLNTELYKKQQWNQSSLGITNEVQAHTDKTQNDQDNDIRLAANKLTIIFYNTVGRKWLAAWWRSVFVLFSSTNLCWLVQQRGYIRHNYTSQKLGLKKESIFSQVQQEQNQEKKGALGWSYIKKYSH